MHRAWCVKPSSMVRKSALALGGFSRSKNNHDFHLGWFDIRDFRQTNPAFTQGRNWDYRFCLGRSGGCGDRFRSIGYRDLGYLGVLSIVVGIALGSVILGVFYRPFDARRATFPDW